MKIKKLNESSLVDKKVSTLGKAGKPMYFTAAQLKDAKEKYPEYDCEETTIEYSLPAGQKAYIAKKKTNESKSIKVFGAKAKKLDEAEEILYVIKDSHGNQLSKPTADDSELWDRVASMEARGRRGLRVVVYTGKKESLDEDKGQPRSNRYRTYFNRIKRAIEKGDEETLKRTKEAIMYAPAKELKNSEASELMDMIKNRKINEPHNKEVSEGIDGWDNRTGVIKRIDKYLYDNPEAIPPKGYIQPGSRAYDDAVSRYGDYVTTPFGNISTDDLMQYARENKLLTEASYGGAFDIADDQYFTRDDLNSFAEEVLGHISETFEGNYDIGGVWFEDGHVITQIVDSEGNEFEDKTRVDMRRIREPWHLKKMYAFPVATSLISQIKSFLDDCGMITENVRGMGKYSDKFYDYLDFLSNEGNTGAIEYLASQLIRYCKEEDLKDLWLDRMNKAAEDNGFDDDTVIEEGIMDEFHTAQRYLDTEIPNICRSAADHLPNMTEDTMKHLNYQCRKFYAIVEDALVAKTDESLTEDVTDVQPLDTGASIGMAAVVSDLIKDEYEAIDGYNSAIATADAEGFEDAVKVLTDIQAEENLHVGQLQELMKLFDANADKVDEGQAEAEEQINNSAETPNNNIEESADMKKERWEEIYDSFKTVEKELNQDGEAVTAVVDQMYRDNKDDPDYKKAYDKWASNE